MTDFREKDDLIIYLLKHDDEKAISIMYNEYYSLLMSICFELVRDKEIAKDLIQDLFFNIWNKRNKLDLRKPIKPYLSRSIINLSYNYIRDEEKSKTVPIIGLDNIKTLNSEALSNLETKELQVMIKTGIRNLPYKYRIAFLLHRKTGMSYKEIAKCLDISEKAVEKRISGALKLLRKFLSPLLKTVIIAFLFRSSI